MTFPVGVTSLGRVYHNESFKQKAQWNTETDRYTISHAKIVWQDGFSFLPKGETIAR